MKKSRGTPDFLLLFLTLGMVGFGIVMIFSASFTVSYWEMGNRWFFTQRQLIWAMIGLIFMLIAMNIPFSFYKERFFLILLVGVGLLLLVFVPGLGQNRNGASSWVGIGSFTIQPAEFAKLSLIIYLAALMSKKKELMKSLKRGLIPALTVVGIYFGLIILQPDFGTGLILLMTAGIMIFAGGISMKHMMYIIAIIIATIPIAVLTAGYRMARITSYLHPWDDPWGTGYHLIQSLIALGNGGIFGTGFGKGIQKFFYLPYPQSDFIFSVMGEELGFIGITLFILFFLFILWRILVISLHSTDSFGTLVGIGIFSVFAIQAFINIGGVTGTIPITGVPLPFISAGGSSLIMSMTSIGLILSLSRENTKSTQS